MTPFLHSSFYDEVVLIVFQYRLRCLDALILIRRDIHGTSTLCYLRFKYSLKELLRVCCCRCCRISLPLVILVRVRVIANIANDYVREVVQ